LTSSSSDADTSLSGFNWMRAVMCVPCCTKAAVHPKMHSLTANEISCAAKTPPCEKS
jgi:hypothetical protein